MFTEHPSPLDFTL